MRSGAGWSVLLDAAAFVPTNRLDLSVVKPDFVTVSFYKMFGYPTGVGCLLVAQQRAARAAASVVCGRHGQFRNACRAAAHILSPREAGFEDGTLNYLSIPAVEIGLRHLERIGIDAIHARVQAL